MTTAIVTGGSRGFGLAVAGELVRAGWDVVLDARRVEDLAAAARSLGASAHAVPGDVRDPLHRRALVDAALSLGGLDLLVNNAGDLGPSPLPSVSTVDPDALGDLFAANVLAPLALLQLALPHLLERGGAVVNVTSDAAVEGYEGWGAYGAAKAALEQLSRVLAVEEPRLRVWWLDPGDMRTDMHQAAFPGEDISDRPLPASVAPAVVALMTERPPSGRVRASELLEGTPS